MYKVDLSEPEVKAIGERRWLRKHWKMLVLVNGGLLLVLFATIIILAVAGVSDIPRVPVGIAVALIWCVVYIGSIRRMEKNGRAFLQLNKETDAEDPRSKG